MLEANAVKKVFLRGGKEVHAVRGVTLKLPPGRLTAIIGRSGSGKSTLLSLLAGILTPTAGEVLLDDKALYTLPDNLLSRLRSEKIGVIPQGQTALQSLSVLENVLLPCALYPSGEDCNGRARALLEQVGIAPLADARPATLSGGELRRMAIARALIRQPAVLLADEPTSDLDGENSAAVTALLRAAADDGAAVLLVTHELSALDRADAVYSMEDGVLSRA